LVNSLYILDEPSIGLHPRDNHRLIKIIKGLRDLGNTIVVVEHDPEIISQSDFMLDMGPKAGEQGGQVIYFGPTSGVKNSLTGQYLKGKKVIPMPVKRRRPKKGISLIVKGAAAHNLKQIDVEIPLGLLVCLTGVSGSGKSSLAEEIIYKGIKRAKGDSKGSPGTYKTITGIQRIDEVVLVDQRPIGRTPRANPLTYTKALDPVRRLLAATASARSKGFDPGYFSFNVAKGRCDTCKGEGFEKVEMQFLSDVYLTCPSCNGKRFKKNVLEITYREKNISDIFSMTVDQAISFFQDHPQIIDVLRPLPDVGLGYIRLGQPINTLSGGEAQRLKLSRYLKGGNGGPQLFIFDEPTTGLHFEDINMLLTALQRVVDQGNSVLIIEHNMDVVKAADWVIDLGPEGGDAGGEVVVSGPPEKVAGHAGSHTGKFLKKYLSSKGRLRSQKRRSKPVPKSRSNLSSKISIKGAKENNLRDLSLTIPRQKLVVITGVSGSGKSTLAYDILFAEGQRRYLETLAPYVRQYVKILERPDVDAVLGLPATVAIQQRISHRSRRSTVATLTEIYHFLRLLYSKLGHQHCPGCNRRMTTQTMDEIVQQIQKRYQGKHPRVLAPKVSGRKGFHKEIFTKALFKGFSEARVDGEITARAHHRAGGGKIYRETIPGSGTPDT
jgi:excinuclease ABC subunit A